MAILERHKLDNESYRAHKVEQRKILGDYYRQLASDYEYLWNLKQSYVWPNRPNIPFYEND